MDGARAWNRNEDEMTVQVFRKAIRSVSAGMILAGLLGAGCLAGAAAETKKPAAPAPKPAAKAPAKPAGGSGGGASHGPSTGGASHGPTTGGAASHGPTANGPRTTTGGEHTTAGGRPGAGGGAGHPGAGGANHSAIRGGSAPRGSNERVTRGGSAVRTRSNGRVSDVHDPKRGMDVHNGLGGGRRVSVERADHSRVYAERGRRGYVERGYSYHGHDFDRRSYYYNGRSYDRFYRGYGYRGLDLSVYAPGFYFHPGFYGWAYNPWAAPIAFGWGFAGSPWYGYYGGYFQPYATYPSAAYWLTDYIVSQDLQAAYAAHQSAGENDGAPAAAGGAPVLTPEVKQMVADEVRDQLALENQEAAQNAAGQDVDPGSSGIARLLSDGRPHVFVAGGNLDVTDASGQECVVSDGDTLQLRTAPPADATTANLVVLSSKGTPDCQMSLTVLVQLTDLQEMQNHMRETIDQGLQELQSKQGSGGFPAAPPSAQAAPAPAQYAAVAPPPEPNVGTEIAQVDKQGDQAQQDASADPAQGNVAPAGGTPTDAATPAPAASPASVALGQTPDEVKAALGAPTRVANLGPKVIYYYSGMKVTFSNGKVSNVQ